MQRARVKREREDEMIFIGMVRHSHITLTHICFLLSIGWKIARDSMWYRHSGSVEWRQNEFESGGTGPERKLGAPRAGKIFFLVVPFYIFGSKSTISRFGERFCDGQYSLVSLLFAVLLLTVPPCPAICKIGGTCRPPVLHRVGATGSVTITFESSRNAAPTSSRVNFSRCVGHATIFSWMFTIARCLVVGLKLGLGLGTYLVFGWLVVMHTYSYCFRLSLWHWWM